MLFFNYFILLIMGLKRLDLLSNSPKNFIFQNNSNKTNFGGSLTLIFLLSVLIIFAYYLILFITEDNYSIQYTFNEKYIDNKEKYKREDDDRYNPYFYFSFDLDGYGINDKLSEDIVLANDTLDNDDDPDVLKIIPRNTILYKRVTDIDLIVLLKCNETNKNCTIPFDRLVLCPKFNGFILEHQNSESPLHKMEGSYLQEDIIFFPNDPANITYKWRNIKYNPEAGLAKLWNNLRGIDDEKQKYIGLRPIDYKFTSFKSWIENNEEMGTIESNGTIYKVLSFFKFEIDFDHYDEYTRTKKSFLDVLSNVFSLSLGVFNALSTFLTIFYSSNFDNYKIIEKILFDIKPEKKEKSKKISIITSSKNMTPLLDIEEKENEIKAKNDIEEENYNFGNENNFNETGQENIENKRVLPKFRFVDFILNNFYCNKKCKNNRQEIISKCNKLISQYYSIDNILYNQIKFENLLIDYKWNNPDLNKLDNNELIIQLKNLISAYDII